MTSRELRQLQEDLVILKKKLMILEEQTDAKIKRIEKKVDDFISEKKRKDTDSSIFSTFS